MSKLNREIVCKAAGCIPYTIKDGEVLLLLHTKEKGRKVGYFIDCGGSAHEGESLLHCACREFNEESFGFLFLPVGEDEKFSNDLHNMERSDRVMKSIDIMYDTFDPSNPSFICPKSKYKVWTMKVDHVDLTVPNSVLKRFGKCFSWVPWSSIVDTPNSKFKNELFPRLQIRDLFNHLMKIQSNL
jgi:hypothetical protein